MHTHMHTQVLAAHAAGEAAAAVLGAGLLLLLLPGGGHGREGREGRLADAAAEQPHRTPGHHRGPGALQPLARGPGRAGAARLRIPLGLHQPAGRHDGGADGLGGPAMGRVLRVRGPGLGEPAGCRLRGAAGHGPCGPGHAAHQPPHAARELCPPVPLVAEPRVGPDAQGQGPRCRSWVAAPLPRLHRGAAVLLAVLPIPLAAPAGRCSAAASAAGGSSRVGVPDAACRCGPRWRSSACIAVPPCRWKRCGGCCSATCWPLAWAPCAWASTP